MHPQQLHIALIPGPNDRALESLEYQKELLDLEALLLPYHPQVPATLKRMEAVAALPGDHSGEIILLGQFVLALGAVLPSIKSLASFLLDWKKANGGREVSLEIDGVKAKAQTIEQIEKLLKIAEEHAKGLKHGS